MKNFNQELFDFIKIGTTSFTCIENIKNILLNEGYIELSENEDWKLSQEKYFVIRNDSSLIAFNIPHEFNESFNIVATHSDTPAFIIKPNPEYFENGYLKLNIAPYGGILNYGFMDTPLSIAGRIITKNKQEFQKRIIDLKEPLAIIPSIAIHQNDKANSNLDLNTEIDLMPIIGLNKNLNLKKIIQKKLKITSEIYDYDLLLYNTIKPKLINDTFIASPRIDNLSCTYAALKAFINNFNQNINVLAVFNSEEIGSNTLEGADSNFLIDTLKKICLLKKIDLTKALASSLIISADNTHASHPNHKELNDHTNTPKLNDGILIAKEINGTTNSISSTIFKYICEKNKIPISYYTSRNDFATGSTLASLSLKHLSINSLDIGLPMLAMHSGIELIGNKDTYNLYKALNCFYQTNFSLTNNKITFK